jgi:hypothetical protein
MNRCNQYRIVEFDNVGNTTIVAVSGIARAFPPDVTGTIDPFPSALHDTVQFSGTASSSLGVDYVTVFYWGPSSGWICISPPTPENWNCSLNTALLADGTYTMRLNVFDTNSNLNGTPITKTFVVDNTAPTGGFASYYDGELGAGPLNVELSSGNDPGTGIESWNLQRSEATYDGNLCGVFSTWSDIGPTSAASPWSDNAVDFGNCYRYRIKVTDFAGNVATFASSEIAAIDPPASPGQIGLDVDVSGGTTNTAESGATDAFTVALQSQPPTNVTVFISTDSQVVTWESSVTFTPFDWNNPQLITVAAFDDLIAEADPHSGEVQLTTSSAAPSWNGLTIPPLSVAVTDNDYAGIAVFESGGSTDVCENGANDTYELVLVSQPTSDVYIYTSPDADVVTFPSFVVFTAENWNTPQVIEVDAVNDADFEGNHPGRVGHLASSSDPHYNTNNIADVIANVTDDEM